MTKPISLTILRARMSAHLEQKAVINALGNEKADAERSLDQQTRSQLNGRAHGGPEKPS